jgi:hypothetical protein
VVHNFKEEELSMKAKNALSLALAAGFVSTAGAAEFTPKKIADVSELGQGQHVAHIYFNVVTGEKITTLLGDDAQRPSDGEEGTDFWAATTGAACAEFGDTSSFYWGMDNPTGTTTYDFHAIAFDWGDLPFDTVVDCVEIHWAAGIEDTDTDSDSAADGIEGLAGNWVYWDGFNGRAPQSNSIPLPIVGFTFTTLPGGLGLAPGQAAIYTADIDLGASGTFGTSLMFEIGDTDSDMQEAAFHNALMFDNDADGDLVSDADPDQDGRADWAWSAQWIQPGTVDLDNADSDSNTTTGVDGDVANQGTMGLFFGSPTPGHAEQNTSDGSWDWVYDGAIDGDTEGFFQLGTTENLDGSGEISLNQEGAFWFGAFDCSPGTPGYTPPAHFEVILYGPGDGVPPCPADLNNDGALDFFDVAAFLGLFGAGDLAADWNNDLALDFFDVAGFLGDFGAGCP